MPDANAPAILKGKMYRAMRINAACHPQAGLQAFFIQERLLLVLKCRLCLTEIMRCEVAKEFSRANTFSTEDDGLAKLSG